MAHSAGIADGQWHSFGSAHGAAAPALASSARSAAGTSFSHGGLQSGSSAWHGGYYGGRGYYGWRGGYGWGGCWGCGWGFGYGWGLGWSPFWYWPSYWYSPWWGDDYSAPSYIYPYPY
jgi:hypothetical protein